MSSKASRTRTEAMSGISSRIGRRMAASLLRGRHALATRLLENLAGWAKYDVTHAMDEEKRNSFIKQHFYVFVDYLERSFATGDPVYKSLYIGEKLKLFYDPVLTHEEDIANRRKVTEADILVFRDHILGELGEEAATAVEVWLRCVQGILIAQGRKEFEVLLIGDCLYLDVRGFLAPVALEDGITIHPTFVTSKNPIEQRNELRRLSNQRFDLIFYSPLTYEFSQEFTATHNWRNALAGKAWIDRVVGTAMEDIEKNLDLLGALFDTPVYVHNTANVRRHDSSPIECSKCLITRRTRFAARHEVNRRLALGLAARRAAGANLILFDEYELLSRQGDIALGRFIYSIDVQHPAELGRQVALSYREILTAHASLMGKKVVVCDLDNTLWKGEIGEGAVEHFIRPQAILKELRRRGVLLTINSKNDPKNVHWDGAVLQEDDFVDMRINWDSKVVNMRRTQQALNIKLKDFVFIDDRADQRGMVSEAIPEILAMDATSERTWQHLAIWASALPDEPETDRTRQYREREQRENFMSGTLAAEENPTALFAKLEIRVDIRSARYSELKRVTELINRTNQFNQAGSRMTLKEVREWYEHPERRIIIVEASDKFGAMGLICVALLDLAGSEIQITVFVLSCRVFGYGIEDVVLNAIKRLALLVPGGAPKSIRGSYRETSHNAPGRSMYPRNGFTRDGDSWICTPNDAPKDPTWLTVVDRFVPTGLVSQAT